MIWRSLAAAAVLAGLATGASAATPDQLKRFDAAIDPAEMAGWMRTLTAGPNHVGAPHNRANAERIRDMFQAWGWEARIEPVRLMYPTPVTTELELLGPAPFKARLAEPSLPAGALPPYAAFGADGEVTAPLVYVNFGTAEDYARLAEAGVSVAGKIVIARYGRLWRGLKPKLAQAHGAVGAILYSDPRDDGYFQGDVYPKGPMRPGSAVQRGSVVDLPTIAGDPTTPGWSSLHDPRRLTPGRAAGTPTIPVLPIGYDDALPLLAALEGPVAPEAWRGALPVTYRLGGHGPPVRLKVESRWQVIEASNLIATLKGRTDPDQWILRGNHRDAWVLGAWDPMSGTVAMLAEAKALGGLVRTGWRPRRTIVYASWDAEEPGVFGSTEWVETHAEALKAKAVLYVNSDANAKGTLTAEGSASLSRLVEAATDEVADPETGGSVGDRLRRGRLEGRPFRLAPIGSGSDYAAFVHHLGVPAMDLYFGGVGGEDAVYHSADDSYDHYSRFGDPGFAYAATLARVAGRIVLAAADDASPPQRFTAFADEVAGQVAELKAKREAAALDFTPLDVAVIELAVAARDYDLALAGATPAALDRAGRLAQQVDQALTLGPGLPGRPWHRNLATAPGRLTGYEARTLPGVREAIEAGDRREAQAYIGFTAAAFAEYARRVSRARAVLSAASMSRRPAR